MRPKCCTSSTERALPGPRILSRVRKKAKERVLDGGVHRPAGRRASAKVPRLAAAGYNLRRLLAWLARLALLLSALLAALAIE